MAWKDINTGQVTDYYPATGQGGANNIIAVPDDPVYLPQNHTGVPDPFLPAQQLGADPRFHKFLKWCFVVVAIGLCLFVLYGLVVLSWNRLMKADVAAHKGKPSVWTATSLEWSGRLFHSNGQPIEVGGPDAIITGNINGLRLDAFSNLTMQGDVTNSSLTAYQTLTVGNVNNSTLTAHRIVITGHAVNVKQIILRPSAK